MSCTLFSLVMVLVLPFTRPDHGVERPAGMNPVAPVQLLPEGIVFPEFLRNKIEMPGYRSGQHRARRRMGILCEWSLAQVGYSSDSEARVGRIHQR